MTSTRDRQRAAIVRTLLGSLIAIASPVDAADTGSERAGQENVELTTLINDYRSAPRVCDGKRIAPAGPLAPDAALARAHVTSGKRLQDAIKDAGYLAARAESIMVTGPTTPSAVMAFIKNRYCRLLTSPRYGEIGASRKGNIWHIVFAQPLLSDDIGDWEEAGKKILELVNRARTVPRTCGDQSYEAASALGWNAKLAAAALAHSRDMAGNNYFRHTGKDNSEAGDRVWQEGYRWRRIGENIATGQGSPEEVVDAWLASPLHCKNIMNASFTEMGAAFVVNRSADTVVYWTQVFGTPHSRAGFESSN